MCARSRSRSRVSMRVCRAWGGNEEGRETGGGQAAKCATFRARERVRVFVYAYARRPIATQVATASDQWQQAITLVACARHRHRRMRPIMVNGGGEDWECGTGYALGRILVRRSSFLDSVVFRVSLGRTSLSGAKRFRMAVSPRESIHLSFYPFPRKRKGILQFFFWVFQNLFFLKTQKKKCGYYRSSLDSSLKASEETRNPVERN